MSVGSRVLVSCMQLTGTITRESGGRFYVVTDSPNITKGWWQATDLQPW